MKRKSIRILIALFFLQIAVMITWYNVRKPRILVLHSYFTDYSRVLGVNAGIKKVFENRNDYLVRWHYLDTKRRPWKEYKENAGNVARRLVREWSPDVIISIDDDSQEYAAKHFIGAGGIKIVFAGISGEPGRYGYRGAGNVTGIIEHPPLAAIREALMSCLAPSGEPLRVMYLGDVSEKASGDERRCRHFNWNPLRFAGSRMVKRYDEWKKAVREMHGEADIILVSSYLGVSRGKGKGERDLVPPGEIIAWTEANSRLPVIGMNPDLPEHGGMLAIAASPAEQGETAARMAVDIIDNGKVPGDIPGETTSRFVISMRKSRAEARGFKVPRIYEEFAKTCGGYYK